MASKTFRWSWLAGWALLACQSDNPPQKFAQNGVSFSCPADWECGEVKEVGSNAFNLSCEKRGFGSSGLVAVSWFPGRLELPELQQVFRTQLKDNPIYKMSDLSFGALSRGHYGRYTTLVAPFKLRLLDLPHTGMIHTFYGGGKTFVVLTQQATEDSVENRAGFAAIAQSFQSQAAH